jgi:NAD(P)H dehydrogenase (quinone)
MKKLCSFFVLILLLNTISIMAQNKAKILVLIHSDNGGTYELAKEIAKGIESENNVVLYQIGQSITKPESEKHSGSNRR